MLVLSRKLNQAIMIGDNVRIVVVSVDRDQVKLGIDAPREIPVHRSEVFDEIQRANREAAALAEAPEPVTPVVEISESVTPVAPAAVPAVLRAAKAPRRKR